jgi:hypothetical protein
VSGVLDEASRAGLARVLDLILPGAERLPAGTAVHAQGDLLDRVLAADPTLIPVVSTVGRRAAEAGAFALSDLEEWADGQVERLVFALNAAYYMSSEVRAAVGYPGQRRMPVSEATPDQLVSDELIAPVLERGSIYVEAPE